MRMRLAISLERQGLVKRYEGLGSMALILVESEGSGVGRFGV